MSVFTNRILNLKQIKAIGFDMDYTLVRYNTKAFEKLSYEQTLIKLVKVKKYPKEILKGKFNFSKAIRGLILDRDKGNLLKVSTYGVLKSAKHGTKKMDFKDQQKAYKGLTIDLNNDNYVAIDTSFSLAHAVIFAQLVDLKDKSPKRYPNYGKIESDIKECLDIAHMDGSLKDVVTSNLSKYIIKDKETVKALLRLKNAGKKLWVITNSDFHYTRSLLDYTITPFLEKGMTWADLFDITIVSSQKPRFFTDRRTFYEIDLETGYLKNTHGPFTKGIFHGGSASVLQKENNFSGDDILYMGDHIFGDILSLKKSLHWRTALVIEELATEVENTIKTKSISIEIEKLMNQKIKLEKSLDLLYLKRADNKKVDSKKFDAAWDKLKKVDEKIGPLIQKYQKHFNLDWGEVMRSGQDPSSFAGQVERYADIYMSKVSDMSSFSPRHYFRPKKRPLVHEL